MSRPPRLQAFPYLGPRRYFLTFCVRNRCRVFLDDSNVNGALLQFRKTAALEAFAIMAYCFMPDHTHLLVEGTSDRSDLRSFAKLAKQRSGAAHALGGSGRLWQEGYYDRILRDDDDPRAIARYIVANPVRGGLVLSPHEYPYVGSDVWPLSELLDGLQW